MTDGKPIAESERRTFLKTVGLLGAAAVGSTTVGSVIADEHLDDYHRTLQEDLASEYDLPSGTFCFGSAEDETTDAFSYDASGAGESTTFDVESDSVPITRGVRCTVEDEPSDSWGYTYQGFLTETDLSEGDVLLGVAYVRSETDGAQTEAQFKFRYRDSEDGDWQYQDANYIQDSAGVQPSEEWTRYFFPIEVDDEPGVERDPYLEFWLGYQQQTVEFGGLALIDYSDADVAVGDLPSGAASAGDGYETWSDTDDPYYSELVSDLEGYNLEVAGQFVNGTDESTVWDTYEIRGGNADLVERSSLEVGDDVPFSEAARFEVTEAPENPWGISVGSDGQRDLESGQVLLGVAYMRTPDDEAQVTYKATASGNEADNYVTKTQPPLDGEWERYYFPIEYGTSAASGEWWTEIWLGGQAQTVDVGGLAVIDFARGVSVDDLPVWEADTGGEWEAEADARIQDHRTTDVEVEVVGPDGSPVEGADVEVVMQEHDFDFGTAISADHLVENTEEGDQYREIIREDFNTAVLGNHHKWQFFEDSQDIADTATAWLADQGKTIRGHVCLWPAVDSWAVPPDVVRAMGVEWEDGDVTDPELDPDHVRERTFAHIEEIISHYADFQDYGSVIDEWEVHNETSHRPGFIKAIRGLDPDEELDVDPVEAPVLAEWHAHAEDVAPEDVGIAINDYNALVGPYESTREDHNRMAEFLVEEGVDLDGIGLQSHFSQGSALSPEEIWEGLEYYTGHGAGIRITEFDMADENWAEAEKAEFFHRILKVTFSHPNVDQFLVWGFQDSLHWQDDAPFFDADWNAKPAYDVWQNLVFDEWWTEESGETDGDGVYATSAFKGDYEITASATNMEGGAAVTIDDETDRVTVELERIGLPGGEGEPTDPDGDDDFEDVDGDGDVDMDDVRTLDRNMRHPDVRNDTSFDFNDDGEVDHRDLIALFFEVR